MAEIEHGREGGPSEKADAEDDNVFGVLVDNLRIVVIALAIAFALRALLFEPFHIPSSSMAPTLLTGDYVFTAKYAYGYSRVSASPIPLPFIHGRFPAGAPRRGDVVVFKNRLDGGKDYIKRVVGLPGDRVQMIGGALHVNGEPAAREPLGVFAGVDEEGRPVEIHRFRETLPSGKSYVTQHYTYADGTTTGWDDTYEYEVPDGGYFVMGDNRDASVDSRWIGRVGYVPIEDVVGRAQFVLVSFKEDFRLFDPRTWLKLRGDRTFRVIACGV